MARFPPRKNVMDLGPDRAESPAGASPYAGSPRFFADDVQSGRSTPNALQYNAQSDNDEVYPTLGAGLGALALNRQVSGDSHASITGSGTYLETVQEAQPIDGTIPPNDKMVTGLDEDDDDDISNASTLLDEDDHFDPDTDAPTSALEPAVDSNWDKDDCAGLMVMDSSNLSAPLMSAAAPNRARNGMSRSGNDAACMSSAKSVVSAHKAGGHSWSG